MRKCSEPATQHVVRQKLIVMDRSVSVRTFGRSEPAAVSGYSWLALLARARNRFPPNHAHRQMHGRSDGRSRRAVRRNSRSIGAQIACTVRARSGLGMLVFFLCCIGVCIGVLPAEDAMPTAMPPRSLAYTPEMFDPLARESQPPPPKRADHKHLSAPEWAEFRAQRFAADHRGASLDQS